MGIKITRGGNTYGEADCCSKFAGFEKDPFDSCIVSVRCRRAQRIRCQWPWHVCGKSRKPATGFLVGRLDDLISGRLVECDEYCVALARWLRDHRKLGRRQRS